MVSNKEYQKLWRKRNPEKTAEYSKRYREKNKEKYRENNRKYRETHKELRRKLGRKYRIKMSNSPEFKFKDYQNIAKFGKRKWNLTFKEFMNFWQKPCYYCGSKIKNIGLDRIDSKKGYEKDNLIPCCWICNRMKHTLGQKEFLNQCLKIIQEQNLFQKERQKIIDEILKELPKERIYEKEIKEFKIDNSSIEGEFHEKFLEGFNQALQEIKEIIEKI